MRKTINPNPAVFAASESGLEGFKNSAIHQEPGFLSLW